MCEVTVGRMCAMETLELIRRVVCLSIDFHSPFVRPATIRDAYEEGLVGFYDFLLA